MNRLRIAWTLAACVGAVGCQSARELRTEMLERELRMQEDCIFELEDELDLQEQRLAACRRENEALRRELGGTSGGSPSGDYYTPPVGTPPDVSAPGIEDAIPFEPAPDAGPLDEAPPYQGPPEIDPIDPAAPPRHSPEPSSGSGALERLQFLLPREEDEPDETDFHIAGITLNRMLTGGYDADGHFGDEGVMVVVEPRNAAGRIVNAPAQISVVVMDPALPQAAGRVARWDFAADEAANQFRRTPLARGMQFQLPWPDAPPERQDLELHVRAITTDGREFRAKRSISIDVPGRPSHRWTTTGASANDAASIEMVQEYAHATSEAASTLEPTAPASTESPDRSRVNPREPVRAVSVTERHDAAPAPPPSLAESEYADEGPVSHVASSPDEPRRLDVGRGAEAPRRLVPVPEHQPPRAWSPYR